MITNPIEWVSAQNIKHSSKYILLLLAACCPNSVLSYQFLSENSGLSRSQIKRHVRYLEQLGLITLKSNYDFGGTQLRNQLTVNFDIVIK